MKRKRDETRRRKAGAKTAASNPGAAGSGRADAEDFQAASAELGGSAPAGGSLAADPFGITAWANRHGRLIRDPFFERLPLLSNSTSEHEVWFHQAENRVYKRTWPGFFGQIPEAGEGKLDRRPATAAEYLARQALQNEIFDSTLRLVGVHVSDKPSMIIGEPAGQPSFVISQKFVKSASDKPATLEQVAEFMEKRGFVKAPKSYYGWYRTVDQIVVVDAKPDNFVLNAEGMTPIDLQMIQFTSEQMRKAGLAPAK